MRFAGTRIEGFLGDKPDYGALASGADSLRSKESQAATGLMGKTAAAGITAAGQVKGAEITGEAQQAMASAQSQAATMGMIGQIGGAAIGAAGDAGLFSGGGTPDLKWNPSGVDTTSAYTEGLNIAGQDYGSFLSTPNFNWRSN